MAQQKNAPINPEAPWSAAGFALHFEGLGSEAGWPASATLRHSTHPYFELLGEADDALETALYGVAGRYLVRVADAARMPPPVLAALRDGYTAGSGFGWLRVGWGDGLGSRGGLGGERDPRLSFWTRDRQSGQPAADRTLVLLAGNRVNVDSHQRCTGQGVGLRVALQLGAPSSGGQRRVRITGLSHSGLARAEARDDVRQLQARQLLRGAQALLPSALGVAAGQLSIAGLSLEGNDQLRVQGQLVQGVVGTGGFDHLHRVFDWSALYRSGIDKQPARLLNVQRRERRTHMASPLKAFGGDPATTSTAGFAIGLRPTRKSATLDPLRTVEVNPSDNAQGDKLLQLSDGSGQLLLQVMQSSVARPGADVAQVMTVPPASAALRSDDLAAVHAYLRGKELFAHLDAYGLVPGDFFKFAALPLQLRHRARFSVAPDGNTVNAQVRPLGIAPDFFAAAPAASQPVLEVAFGAANLQHTEQLPSGGGPPRQQPLGLAADRRWAWHEFGHVLLAASTGELEFRFAHSMGDALAAIVADPHSALANGTPGDNPQAAQRLRDMTFPWVHINRSHRRKATLGWGWCGRRSRRRPVPNALGPRQFGDYFEEQLMSSSLFTAYESLGGLAANELERRRTASHYMLAVIMHALHRLAPATMNPLYSANAWVAALAEVDVHSSNWLIETGALESDLPAQLHRAGGCAHKVLRWAFQNQGLYATNDAEVDIEGPGLAPVVDVYFEDLRGADEGGYAPVALHWIDEVDQAAPLWHASSQAVWREVGTQNLCVSMKNCGQQPATGVQVRCWVAPATAGATAVSWQELQTSAPPPVSVNAGGMVTTCFQTSLGSPPTVLAGPHFVFAQASCPDDRSNLDPATLLACAADVPPSAPHDIVDLVAGDNNLALRLLDFS